MNKEQKNGNEMKVTESWDCVCAALNREISRVYAAGERAMKNHDRGKASKILSCSEGLEEFAVRVRGMAEEWSQLAEIYSEELSEAAAEAEPIGVQLVKIYSEMQSEAVAVKPVAEARPLEFSPEILTGLYSMERGDIDLPHVSLRGKAANLVVKFADGTELRNTIAANTFAQAIEKIGAARVAALGLKNCGELLVSKKLSEKYPRHCKEVSGGYYVHVNSSTDHKIRQLRTISERLKLGLRVTLLTDGAGGESAGSKPSGAGDDYLD